jgi:hypothetical protein
MLHRGESVPGFDVARHDGSRVSYADRWQKKNLLLVALADADDFDRSVAYARTLDERIPDLTAYETACVITRVPIPGVERPGIVIADRWGEIYFATGGPIEDLPDADGLIEWLRFVQSQCPECQGEAR